MVKTSECKTPRHQPLSLIPMSIYECTNWPARKIQEHHKVVNYMPPSLFFRFLGLHEECRLIVTLDGTHVYIIARFMVRLVYVFIIMFLAINIFVSENESCHRCRLDPEHFRARNMCEVIAVGS
jgi:hypothetical protein